MLTASIDVDRVLQRLERMQQRLEHFEGDLLSEMRDWEVQNVHRRKPGARSARNRGIVGRTLFRPHSRFEIMRSRMAKRHYMKTSTRDILRKPLINRLIARLTRRAQRSLRW